MFPNRGADQDGGYAWGSEKQFDAMPGTFEETRFIYGFACNSGQGCIDFVPNFDADGTDFLPSSKWGNDGLIQVKRDYDFAFIAHWQHEFDIVLWPDVDFIHCAFVNGNSGQILSFFDDNGFFKLGKTVVEERLRCITAMDIS